MSYGVASILSRSLLSTGLNQDVDPLGCLVSQAEDGRWDDRSWTAVDLLNVSREDLPFLPSVRARVAPMLGCLELALERALEESRRDLDGNEVASDIASLRKEIASYNSTPRIARWPKRSLTTERRTRISSLVSRCTRTGVRHCARHTHGEGRRQVCCSLNRRIP